MLRIWMLLLLSTLIWPAARAQALTVATTVNAGTTAATTQPIAPIAPVVYAIAEEMPAFPGGTSAFLQFLQVKIKYPDEALRRHISGKVHVRFIVDEEGRILDPQVVRGLGYGLDEEALRLVRIMPWWTPGLIHGQPVRVAYVLPIVFRSLE